MSGVRAVVTGGSRGLGRAVVQALASGGARVAATATHVVHLADLDSSVIRVPLDLADAASVESCARAVRDALGGIDLLVNNAGVLGYRGELLNAPADDVATNVETNLLGTLRLTRALVGAMGHGAAIVNVSSGAAGRPGWAGYAVSKAGLDAATHVLRHELAPRGIRVVGVNPGGLRTDMRADAYPEEDPSTLPEPSSVAPLFLAIAAGADPGEHVDAREWRP